MTLTVIDLSSSSLWGDCTIIIISIRAITRREPELRSCGINVRRSGTDGALQYEGPRGENGEEDTHARAQGG